MPQQDVTSLTAVTHVFAQNIPQHTYTKELIS